MGDGSYVGPTPQTTSLIPCFVLGRQWEEVGSREVPGLTIHHHQPDRPRQDLDVDFGPLVYISFSDRCTDPSLTGIDILSLLVLLEEKVSHARQRGKNSLLLLLGALRKYSFFWERDQERSLSQMTAVTPSSQQDSGKIRVAIYQVQD